MDFFIYINVTINLIIMFWLIYVLSCIIWLLIQYNELKIYNTIKLKRLLGINNGDCFIMFIPVINTITLFFYFLFIGYWHLIFLIDKLFK